MFSFSKEALEVVSVDLDLIVIIADCILLESTKRLPKQSDTFSCHELYHMAVLDLQSYSGNQNKIWPL